MYAVVRDPPKIKVLVEIFDRLLRIVVHVLERLIQAHLDHLVPIRARAGGAAVVRLQAAPVPLEHQLVVHEHDRGRERRADNRCPEDVAKELSRAIFGAVGDALLRAPVDRKRRDRWDEIGFLR